MRISLHYGPIFEHFDAVQGAQTFYGTEVTVAARIEPRVPVGAIYTTQPFAAMIDPTATIIISNMSGRWTSPKIIGTLTLAYLVTVFGTSPKREIRALGASTFCG